MHCCRWMFEEQIVTAVQPVFLSPLVDQLTRFRQVSTLTMLQHIFSIYGAIYEINHKENKVKMIWPYNPDEPLT